VTKFEELVFYPITGWHIGPLSGHPAIVLQFSYTEAQALPGTDPQESVFFGLTAGMTRKLIASLNQHLTYIEDPDYVAPKRH